MANLPNQGTVSDTGEETLRKNLNPALKGTVWQAVCKAIGYEDELVSDNAALTLDQLNICSASEKYLDQRGEGNGVQRPPKVGMPDELYRKLALIESNGALTQEAILEVLEVYYGTDAVKACVTSIAEPFSLADNDDLIMLINGKDEYKLFFDTLDFTTIGAALAIEVCVALNKFFQLRNINVISTVYVDPETQLNKLKIYSDARGIGSSIQITGGKAQNALQFNTRLDICNSEYILVANSYNNNIIKINASDGSLIDTYNIGCTPSQIVSDGVYLWISLPNSNKVTKMKISDGSIIGNYSVGEYPYGICYGDTDIWTANSLSNTVTKLKASDGSLIGTYSVGNLPLGLCYDGTNIWVANTNDDTVTKLLAATGALVGTYATGTYPGAVAFDGTNIWIANILSNNVTKLLAATGALVGTYATGTNPEAVIFAGAHIWTANYGTDNVTKLLAATGATIGTYAVGSGPNALSYDGTYIWVTNSAGNSITKLLASTGATIGTYTSNISGPSGITYGGGILPTWTITFNAVTNIATFTSTAAIGGTGLDISLLRIGDYVNIYGTEFNAGNRGSFEILTVSNTYSGANRIQAFTILNPNGVAQAGIGQVSTSSIYYFRPDKQTIFNYPNYASVLQSNNESYISLAATTQAVSRKPNTAAYPPINDTIPVLYIERYGGTSYISTSAPHGLTGTKQLLVDSTYSDIRSPYIWASSLIVPYTTSYSSMSLCDKLITSPITGITHNDCAILPNYDVLIGGGISALGALPTKESALFHISWASSYGGTTQYTYDLIQDTDALKEMEWYTLTYYPWDENVWQIGGFDPSGATVTYATSTLYTPSGTGAAGTWAASAYALVEARSSHTTNYVNSKLVIVGGAASNIANRDSWEYFDVGTLAWIKPASVLTDSRCSHVSVNIGNTLLVIGGRKLSATTTLDSIIYTIAAFGTPLNTCEIIDTVALTVTQAAQMTYTRVGHKAITLSDGRILVTGGYGYNPSFAIPATLTPLSTCEIYDPNTGFWTCTDSMSIGRAFHAMWLDSVHNRVYVYGGNNSASNITEYLDLNDFVWKKSTASTTLNYNKSYIAGMSIPNVGYLAPMGTKTAAGAIDDTIELIIPNNDIISSGKLNGVVTGTYVDAYTLSYPSTTNNYSYASFGINVTPMGAQTQPLAGPYIFDPKDGLAISSSITTLNQTLSSGMQYKELTVADTSTFTNEECYLVIGFGYNYQTSPIKCYGVISSTKLLIDYSFEFPYDIPINASVIKLEQRGGYVPEDVSEINAFYITASPEGRIAASQTIEDISAQGIPLTITTRYPGDRGLGNEGQPISGTTKIADKVAVWAGDAVDDEIKKARE